MCIDKIMSENNIIEHGGEIALSYSSHVTHIICDTQDNSLVRQVKYIVLNMLCK